MSKRLTFLIAFLTGALLTLAFPEPDVWPLAWVALAPTLALTRGAGAKRGALVWMFFGLGFFGTLLTWVSIVGWVAWGLLVVEQTPFIVAFGALWGWLSGRTGAAGRIALAAGAWALFEYLRSVFPIGGFTWGQLAQSQHNAPWLLQWASVAGGIFLALVVVAVNAALAELAASLHGRRFRNAIVAGAVIVVAAAGPALILWEPTRVDGSSNRVAIVQGNVDPTVPQDFEKDLRILKRHVALTETLEEPVDLVVWPESAAAIDPDHPIVPPLLERAARAVDAPMIVGGTEDVGDGADRYRVMAFQLSRTGEIVDRYQKTHLVPFGEYVPARDLLDWLPILDQVPRDAQPGDRANVFTVNGSSIATVLSFEGDFGSLVRSRVANGGRVVIVATNTSTWRRSWASAQHVAFSQVRAVENRVPVIHAAISGISAVIGADGRIIRSLPLYEEGTMVVPIRQGSASSLYARFGDPLLFGAIGTCALAWALGARRKKASIHG